MLTVRFPNKKLTGQGIFSAVLLQQSAAMPELLNATCDHYNSPLFILQCHPLSSFQCTSISHSKSSDIPNSLNACLHHLLALWGYAVLGLTNLFIPSLLIIHFRVADILSRFNRHPHYQTSEFRLEAILKPLLSYFKQPIFIFLPLIPNDFYQINLIIYHHSSLQFLWLIV